MDAVRVASAEAVVPPNVIATAVIEVDEVEIKFVVKNCAVARCVGIRDYVADTPAPEHNSVVQVFRRITAVNPVVDTTVVEANPTNITVMGRDPVQLITARTIKRSSCPIGPEP